MADLTPELITYREAVAEGIARELGVTPRSSAWGKTSERRAEYSRRPRACSRNSGPSASGTRPREHPLVVRTANGGGLGFGAQHSQAVENWALAIPGLKIAAPSTLSDVIGMMAATIRSDEPVLFFEHKGLFASKGKPAPDGHVVELGMASVIRQGSDVTLVALPATVPLALDAASHLAAEGISAEVIDLRCLIVADEGFEFLDAPIRRVAAACVPLPFADALEEQVIPTRDKVIAATRVLTSY